MGVPAMYLCPHCGQPGISWLRKLFLGQAAPATCKACGQKVGLPRWWSTAWFVPFVALTALRLLGLFSSTECFWLLVFSFLAASFFQMLLVPLEKR